MKYINVYSWYGADKYVENSGLENKDIKFSVKRLHRIIDYFFRRNLNVMITQTEKYVLVWVSTKNFKQF